MNAPRVLDLSTHLSGMYTSRLLADQGWDVLRVDVPESSALWAELAAAGVPRERTGEIDLHLNRSKDRLSLDLANAEGRAELEVLARGADLIVETFPAQTPVELGLSPAALRKFEPRATLLSISPYGRSGPLSRRLATDKTLWAHAGAMYLCGSIDGPPLAPNVPIVSFAGGLYGCIVAAAEQIRRERHPGPAEGRHLDLSLMDVMSSNLDRATITYTYLQSITVRGGPSRRFFSGYPVGPYRAKDGFFMLVPGSQPISSVALLIERPELIEHPLFEDRAERVRRAADCDALIVGPFAERTVAELVRSAEELRMPCGQILEIRDLFAEAQLAHRGTLRVLESGEVEIEEPWRFLSHPRTPREVRRGGAALSQWRSGGSAAPSADGAAGSALPLPLEGLRVADLTQGYAGPTATRMFSELGADVIKVESITRFDSTTRGLLPADNQPGDEWYERSGYFAERGLGKRGITLRLDTPEGRALGLKLIEKSDIVIWNFSPRVMDNLGLPIATLTEANPEIVITAMSGYGYTGPARNQIALAATMEGTSGLASQVRYHDGETPMLLGFNFLDALSGIYAAAGTLLALERKVRTGETDVLDFATRESAIPFLAYQVQDHARTGSSSVETEYAVAGGSHVVLPAAGDDRWVEVFVAEERVADLLSVLGVAADEQDENWRETANAAARGWEQRELADRLQAERFPAAPVLDAEQVILDDHLHERRLFQLVDRPTVGVRPQARQLSLLADGRPMTREIGPPPRLGQHNDEVLVGLLGVDRGALADLEEKGIIGQRMATRLPALWKRPLALDEMVEYRAIRRASDAFGKLERRFGVHIGL